MLSIDIGAATLRIAPGACEYLWATLSAAITALHRMLADELTLSAPVGVSPRGVA